MTSSWDGQCPLEGTCSECGLTFLWRDICNPDYQRSGRTFEHAGRRLVRSLLFTVLLLHVPGRLWRRLKIVHRMVPHRIGAFAILGLIVTGITGAVMLAALTLVCQIPLMLEGWAWPSTWDSGWYWVRRDVTSLTVEIGITGVLIVWLLTPVLFVLVMRSMREARLRPAHLMRIFAYSCPLLAWPVFASLLVMYAGGLADVWDIELFDMRTWSLRRGLIHGGPAAGIVTAIVIVATWWSIALRAYTRMRHGVAVGVLLTVISSLIAALVSLLLWYGTTLRAMA